MRYKVIQEDYFGFKNILKEFTNKDEAIEYFKGKSHLDTFIADEVTKKEIEDKYY